jgi:hypothetical protein
VADPVLALDILGTSGLRQSGGWVVEEFLRQLRGPRGMELLKEFTMNNPQAGAIRTLVRTLVRGVKWEVQSAKKPMNLDMAKLADELIESAMDDMMHTWHDFIGEALSMTEYGWAYLEVIYKLRRGPKGEDIVRSKHNDGMWGWRKIELRSQDTLDRWEFAPDGEIMGMWQRDSYANRYVFIPATRAVHFRTEKYKNNPEGRSLFRNAIISYLRLKHIEDVEAIGVERDLAGIPFLEVPPEIMSPNASAELRGLRADLEEQLGQIKQDQRAFVMMPSSITRDGKSSQWKFSLLASSGSRQLNVVEIKNSYKTDILMSVLAQFLQLGVNAGGAFALNSSATNTFAMSLGAILDNMEETINRQLIDPLCELNGIAAEDRPCLKHGDIEQPALNEIGPYIQALFGAGGLKMNPKLEQKLMEFAGLPYEPLETPAGVKPADQLIAEVMGGAMDPEKPITETPTEPKLVPPGVKSAAHLAHEALTGNPVKGADDLIEEAMKK